MTHPSARRARRPSRPLFARFELLFSLPASFQSSPAGTPPFSSSDSPSPPPPPRRPPPPSPPPSSSGPWRSYPFPEQRLPLRDPPHLPFSSESRAWPICSKLIFVACAPVYLLFLLRHYRRGGFGKAVGRFLAMGSFLGATFAVAFVLLQYHG